MDQRESRAGGFQRSRTAQSLSAAGSVEPGVSLAVVTLPTGSGATYAVTLPSPQECLGGIVTVKAGAAAAGWTNGAVTVGERTLSAVGDSASFLSSGDAWVSMNQDLDLSALEAIVGPGMMMEVTCSVTSFAAGNMVNLFVLRDTGEVDTNVAFLAVDGTAEQPNGDGDYEFDVGESVAAGLAALAEAINVWAVADGYDDLIVATEAEGEDYFTLAAPMLTVGTSYSDATDWLIEGGVDELETSNLTGSLAFLMSYSFSESALTELAFDYVDSRLGEGLVKTVVILAGLDVDDTVTLRQLDNAAIVCTGKAANNFAALEFNVYDEGDPLAAPPVDPALSDVAAAANWVELLKHLRDEHDYGFLSDALNGIVQTVGTGTVTTYSNKPTRVANSTGVVVANYNQTIKQASERAMEAASDLGTRNDSQSSDLVNGSVFGLLAGILARLDALETP